MLYLLLLIFMATSKVQAAAPTPVSSSDSFSGKKNYKFIAIGIAVLLVIIVVIIFAGSKGGLTYKSTTVIPQSTTPPIYMSPAVAQGLLGAPINVSSNYSATSIYNYSTPANITLLEYLVPALAGNVTNGWVTAAFASGPNNASMQYYVLQTHNASMMSALLAKNMSLIFATLPAITTGFANGLNYTYETYKNSSGSFQSLIGWKDGYVSLMQLGANNFVSNESQIAAIVSNTIP